MSERRTDTPLAKLTELWIDNGMTNAEIREKLAFEGYDEKYIAELLIGLSKLRNSKKTAKGLTLILVGAALCLLSCILTLAHAFPGSEFSFVLFGVTTLGVLFVFGGLVYMFG